MFKEKTRFRNRLKYSLIIGTLIGFLGIVGTEAIAQKEPVRLRFLTSSVGTAWYMMGGVMGDVMKTGLPPGSQVDVAPISGSVANLPMLMKGEGDLAYTFSVVYDWAWRGIGIYDKKPIKDLRVMLANFDTYWVSFAVRAETGITSIEQIKEKKIPLKLALGDKSTILYHAARHIFGEYGMSTEEIEGWGGKMIYTTWPHIVSMIKDKTADAVIWVNTPGHPTWTELAISRDLVFLPIKENLFQNFSKKYGYSASILPAGSFKGVSKDVPSLGFCTIIITHKDKPESLVYTITKGICEGSEKLKVAHKMFETFDPKGAVKGFENYLHPGTAKYFREKNWMK